MAKLTTWVINLASAQQRRAHIQSQQSALNLPEAIWFDAIDGRALSHQFALDAVSDRCVVRRAGRGLSPGELGCALSHRRVWQAFLASGEQQALVLEDDAVLSYELPTILSTLQARLACELPRVITLGVTRLYAQQAAMSLNAKFSLIAPLRGWGGHAYLINRAAAERLVALQTPLRCMADDWWFYQKIGDVQVRAVQPYLASVLQLGDSQLEERRSEMRALKPLRWLRILRFFDRVIHKCYEIYQGFMYGPLRSSEPCTNPHAENTSKKK